MKKRIIKAICKELQRQSQLEKQGTPYFSGDMIGHGFWIVTIDGEVDLAPIADVIVDLISARR